MLLSISCTGPEASDLGFLLHKHPDRVRSVDVGAGRAHVFYPAADTERTTAVLMVEVDPIRLSRGPRGRRAANLEPYVNDRPFVASSMLSVAMAKLYGTAMSGTCDARPEAVGRALDLEVDVPVAGLPAGGELARRLFEPLGWQVGCEVLPLDSRFEGWGASRYGSLTLRGRQTLKDALSHLYVLLPALDGKKHYWVGDDEVDKLIRRGGDWLAAHPESELIARRYLRFGTLARDALARLNDEPGDPDGRDEAQDLGEGALERPMSLNEQRLDAVVDAVVAGGGGSVVDLGCGEGRLLQRLVTEPSVTDVLGVDVSLQALAKAEARLRLDELAERRRDRIELVQGALTYSDRRLGDRDVATIVEVIEHIDAARLDTFARVVFGTAAPPIAIVTTPNREYNVHFEKLPQGQLRHGDHRFEWTRQEFVDWADSVCAEYGYRAEFSAIGPEDPATGPPTQMAVFRKVTP